MRAHHASDYLFQAFDQAHLGEHSWCVLGRLTGCGSWKSPNARATTPRPGWTLLPAFFPHTPHK